MSAKPKPRSAGGRIRKPPTEPFYLNDRHRRFVQEYLIDCNATAAYLRAGFTDGPQNPVGAHRLMHIPEIRGAIRLAQEDLQRRTGLSQDWIVARLIEIVERSLQSTPALDRQGNPTGVYNFDGQTAIKALALLGKQHGMFADKVEGNMQVDVRHSEAMPALQELPSEVQMILLNYWRSKQEEVLHGKEHQLVQIKEDPK